MNQKILSKNRLKHLQSLKLKKNRIKYGRFLAEGQKVVKELLEDKIIEIKALYATSSWFTESEFAFQNMSFDLYVVSKKELERISSLKTANQVVVECSFPSTNLPQEPAGWILYLDGLQDPGNVGSIIRIADWFGCSLVALKPGSVDIFNAKTIQASMGSFTRIAVIYMNAMDLHIEYPQLKWWLATPGGMDIRKLNQVRPGVLVIGHESKGISQDVEQMDHQQVSLPKLTQSKIDSLNAATATSAIMAMLMLRS